MSRGEAAAGVVLGVVFAVGGYLLGNVVEIDGRTFVAFDFGIVVGVALVIAGLVGLVRGR